MNAALRALLFFEGTHVKLHSMARSKNRRKKPKQTKKSSARPKKKHSSVDKDSQESLSNASENVLDDYPARDESDGPGLLTSMRGMVAGGGDAKDGFFSRRRSLTEWALWFAGGTGLYLLFRHFFID